MMRRAVPGFVALAVALVLAACATNGPGSAAGPSAERSLILATTTSTQDSGLLDVLLPEFSRATGWQVKTLAVGSGQAIELGRRGEADVLLVHSPAAEEEFVAEGSAGPRRLVMHNDFVLVGPEADPAGTGVPSTIVDGTGETLRVLRDGAVPLADLREVVPTILGAGEPVTP